MEQEGDGNKKPQDQRLKEMQEDEQVQPQPVPQQPQQPQKCPRCESMNTKFCYYNNYSLSQPRYFCKTCRRYWTQGGTLRNVPVGGGCRKGKRAKNSSSSAENSSRPQPQPQPPQKQEMVQTQPNLTTVMRPKDPSPVPASVPSISPFYQGGGVGGYLSSLAAIHSSLNPPHPFDQSLNVGDDSSNLGLLSGFNIAASLASQRQIPPSQQFYQMGSGSREMEVEPSLYSAEQGLISSSMANSHHDWPQGFIDSANHTASDTSLWSTISTTSSLTGSSDRRNNANAAGSSSLIPNQWPDLPEYGPPA